VNQALVASLKPSRAGLMTGARTYLSCPALLTIWARWMCRREE
jgi:hypothetical protein